MMEGDELELEKIGDRKTALFCIVSDTDITFNFIAAMVYTQMFNVLCDRALQNGGALKTHVTCLLDEFANQKILSFMELIVGGKAGLEPVEKTVIDRCVHMVYRDYLQDPQPEKMPILGDLHRLLCQQPELEAQRLATALEIYVTGSLNVFNHRTNVAIKSRIVCYVIKKLGKQLKKLGMQVVQDQIWGRVSENRDAHRATRLYIDEMRLCTVEGMPDFDSAVRELTALPQRKVLLTPLLFVDGEHAKADMAGEGEGSLRSRLVRAGFRVDCVLRGLGELPAVREMYVERAREAVERAEA